LPLTSLNKLILAASAASIVFAAPVSATEWFVCTDPAETVELGILRGTAGGFGGFAASMAIGGDRWTTDPVYGEGAIFTIGQGFADESSIRADFFDEIVNERVAELRVVHATELGETVFAGTLRVIGRGVWPVVCGGEQ
jgi:hypothetical protein